MSPRGVENAHGLGMDAALASLAAAAAAHTRTELAAAALASAVAVIGADSAVVSQDGQAGRTVRDWPAQFLPGEKAAAFEAIHQACPWPLAVHTRVGSGLPLRSSDLASVRQYRGSRMYAEVFRQLDVDWQAALSIPFDGGGRLCVALNRKSRDFSARDLDRLTVLRRILAVDAARVAHAEVAAAGGGLGALSDREADVLCLVASGLANAQVGRRLGISARTVDKHLEHIYAKTQTQSRTAAAVLWTRAGRAS